MSTKVSNLSLVERKNAISYIKATRYAMSGVLETDEEIEKRFFSEENWHVLASVLTTPHCLMCESHDKRIRPYYRIHKDGKEIFDRWMKVPELWEMVTFPIVSYSFSELCKMKHKIISNFKF